MSIFVNAGRAAVADMVIRRPIHLAIGAGLAEWDTAPPELDYDTTALANEIGRKRVHRALFVAPDDKGPLELPGGKRYAISDTPTRHLYLEFLFAYGEGTASAVKEIGVFVGTKTKETVPMDQSYLSPGDIADGGSLLLLEYPADPEHYNPAKKGSYEVVLSL